MCEREISYERGQDMKCIEERERERERKEKRERVEALLQRAEIRSGR